MILPPAERLRAYRALTRMSTREFAPMVGVHYVTLGRYERGILSVPEWLLDLIDSGTLIGRPVPTVTWTRGNPFKARRRR